MVIEGNDVTVRLARFNALGHLPLPLCARRYLGKMGYTKNLPLFTKFTKQATDDFSHPPADANIDFVENQCRDTRCLTGNHLNRQADSGKLTS